MTSTITASRAATTPDEFSDLFFNFSAEIELHEQNAFHFLLDFDASEYPFAYHPETAARLAAYIQPPPDESAQTAHANLLPLPFWQKPTESVSTTALLLSLVEAIHGNIRYEQREEGAAHPPAETLRLGHASCRDFAVLLAAILRELGLAARLASGYLCQFDQAAKDRKAEGYMHMWTEVFLPGAGWTGLDASNGVFCNHNFITVAVGLTSAEITPISVAVFQQGLRPLDDDRAPRIDGAWVRGKRREAGCKMQVAR